MVGGQNYKNDVGNTKFVKLKNQTGKKNLSGFFFLCHGRLVGNFGRLFKVKGKRGDEYVNCRIQL